MEYSLLCDDRACTRQLGAAANGEEPARLRVLETARESGWDIDNAGHWCPEHRRPR